MPTRKRTKWIPRDDGQFDCRVGWMLKTNGRREQPKFRLGSDLREAQHRDTLLRRMWERIEEISGKETLWDQNEPCMPSQQDTYRLTSGKEALWDQDALHLAKLVAKGEVVLVIPSIPNEDRLSYVHRVRRLGKIFPMLSIWPEREYGAALGFTMLNALETGYAEIDQKIAAEKQEMAEAFRRRMSGGMPQQQPTTSGPGLHEALRAYIVWLEKEYQNPESGVTPWGKTQMGQVESLISHHADVPLTSIGRAEVEEMIGYWRKRPCKKGSTKRVTQKTSSNFISALRNFFKWLHNSAAYSWRKPEDFEALRTSVLKLDSEHARHIRPEQIFTLDELKLLYRYGTPLDRLLILLGLNCGFAAAEAASLLVGEIYLRTPHSARHVEMLVVELRQDDSFIKRMRRKTGVYGEFLLFKETVRGLEWALAERRKHGAPKPDDRLLLNGNGEPLDKQTSSGNANQQIPNRFARLMKRIKADKHSIASLPVKMLRKTGGDIVKRFSNGEIAGVFHCRGTPVVTDDLSDLYTTRPFGKVFETLRVVEEYLAPVFAEGGENPFGLTGSKKNTRKSERRPDSKA